MVEESPIEGGTELILPASPSMAEESPIEKGTELSPSVAPDSEKAGSLPSINVPKLLHRVDVRLVPILSVLYLLCFLCRQNIGNAKTFHMSQSLSLTPKQYQIALTVFFISYSTFDIPCNILLKKSRPSIWLPLITFVSGAVTTCMGLVQNADELIVVRFLLGMSECGLFPGVAYVITMWYCKKEAQFRQALFFCAASMAGAFSGLLAVGLNKMNGIGGLEGWRWILIVEGIVTSAAACIGFFVVLNYPKDATFLTPEEKSFLINRLEVDEFGEGGEVLSIDEQQRIHTEIPKREIFPIVFKDWHIFAHIFVFWGITCPLYSISLCLPSIVKELGYTSTQANLLTIPIYITACILSLVTAFLADRTGKRALFVAIGYIVMFTGFLIAAARPASAPGLAYAGVFTAACGIYPAFPGMITWITNNLASSGKRIMAMAVVIGMGSFGGAMGANFYRSHDAPLYRLGHSLNLMFVSMGAIAIAGLYWSYGNENERREARCREAVVELENAIGQQRDQEEELRRAFFIRKEESLASEGDMSMWFKYTL